MRGMVSRPTHSHAGARPRHVSVTISSPGARTSREASVTGPGPRGSVPREARHDLDMARVLLGVSGGIAAYKACEVTRLLVKAGHEVVPLLTPGAERFVTAETFRALARRAPQQDVYLHLTRADLL